MTCSYCTTELPVGALFCGECGRSVAAAVVQPSRVQVPTGLAVRWMPPVELPPEPAAVSLFAPEPLPVVEQAPGPDAWQWAGSGTNTCQHCGTVMLPDEIFCGHCGSVSQAAVSNYNQPRDTEVIEPLEAPPTPAALPPVASADAPFDDYDDVESTRILRSARLGDRFVLQFSTGESSTVSGSGLIGRNPVMEPGEYFDQLVRVIDPSRSVSKTHLEFGQEGGAFWVMDRYSGNGTVLREPEAEALRCQPERRYRVARGTRIEIGEQFFIVS